MSLRIRRKLFSFLYVSLCRSPSRHAGHVIHVCNCHSASELTDG